MTRGRRGASAFESLRHRNFRMFALAQGISFVGIWMNRTAQDWLVLQLTDNSPGALGIAVAIQFTPVLLLSMWAGLLADRSDNSRLLAWLRLLQAACTLTLAILVVTDVVELWHVFVLAGILGSLTAVEVPVRQALTSEIVGQPGIANALAFNSVTVQGSRMAGPALAGLIISISGTGSVLFITAFSVVIVHWAMKQIDNRTLHTPPRVARRSGQVREGLRYLLQRPDIALVLLLFALVTAFVWNIEVVLAPLAAETFDRGAAGYGQLVSALGVGTLAAAVLATRRRRPPRQPAVIATASALGTGLVALSFVPDFFLFLTCLIPIGVVMLTLLNQVTTTVQMKSDESMRGRMSGYYALSLSGGKPVGALALGWIGQEHGPTAMLRSAGCITVATTLFIAGWMLVLHRRCKRRAH